MFKECFRELKEHCVPFVHYRCGIICEGGILCIQGCFSALSKYMVHVLVQQPESGSLGSRKRQSVMYVTLQLRIRVSE